MADHQNKYFTNETIVLDGDSFQNCTIENCELVYRGGDAPSVVNCTIGNSKWLLGGAAANTIQFMKGMYRDMASRELVEDWIKMITEDA